MKVKEIYAVLDQLAPFSTQDSYDNSGLMTGDAEAEVSAVLLSLDITPAVIAEATSRGCQLIVAHHPAIFDPLRAVPPEHPVYQLIAHSLAAICVHTPLDLATGGVNDCLYQTLREPLALGARLSALEGGYVGVFPLESPLPSEEVALAAENRAEVEGGARIPGESPIRTSPGVRVMGSLLEAVIPAGCDAFVTGDIKHDRWHMAACYGMALYDCGHFHTETLVLPVLRDALCKALSGVEVNIADANTDPVRYVK